MVGDQINLSYASKTTYLVSLAVLFLVYLVSLMATRDIVSDFNLTSAATRNVVKEKMPRRFLKIITVIGAAICGYSAISYSKIYNYMLDEKNTADGAYDAGWYWCYNFEVPANRETVSVTRGNLAKNTYWEQYGKDEIAPPAISNLQNLENGILLQWKVTAGVSGYNIYRKTSLSDAWTQIDSVSDGDINRYTDKNVSCGTNYYYAVTSYVGDNAYDTYMTTELQNRSGNFLCQGRYIGIRCSGKGGSFL